VRATAAAATVATLWIWTLSTWLTGWKAINYIANLYVATMKLLTASSASINQSLAHSLTHSLTLSLTLSLTHWVNSTVNGLSGRWVVPSLVPLFSNSFLAVMLALQVPLFIWPNGDKRWPTHQLGHSSQTHNTHTYFIRSERKVANLAFIFIDVGPLVESSHVTIQCYILRYIPLIGLRPTNNVQLNSYNKDSSKELAAFK